MREAALHEAQDVAENLRQALVSIGAQGANPKNRMRPEIFDWIISTANDAVAKAQQVPPYCRENDEGGLIEPNTAIFPRGSGFTTGVDQDG